MGTLLQRRLVLLIPLALFSVSLQAQSPKSKTPIDEYKESASNTYFVTCGKEPPYKTRTAVSPVLVSPNGENAAFAKVRVRVGGGVGCLNESELFIKVGKNQTFKRVLLIKPEEQQQANGLKLVDWSPDKIS